MNDVILANQQKGLVLVVDDTRTNRFLLVSILKSQGYEVAEAVSGVECLEYCARQLPDTVLLDFMMPDLDGIAVCRKLRENYAKASLPIIMVTAKMEGADVKSAIDAGANDYITKPVDRVSLLARLENQLLMARSHQELKRQRQLVERSLELQKAMGDVLPEALLVHDPSGHIVYENEKFRQYCGGDSPANLVQAFASVFDGALLDFLSTNYSYMSEDPARVLEREVEVKHARYKNIEVITRPIKLDAGGALRLWVWRDLTHVRELEERIKQQMKLETVATFAAGVAHNFNNIMGSILGAAELLRKLNKAEPRAARLLKVIDKSIESGRKLTRRMATVVRRDVGGSGVKRERLIDLIQQICAIQQALIGDKIRYEIDVAAELPLVEINPINLTDILANILNNAADAISVSGEIRVESFYKPKSKFIELVISDTGSGMPERVLEKVFEPFYSTKNLDTRNGVSMEGHGLGLWTVHSLLSECGGSISIQSAEGQGTKVFLTLPVLQGPGQ